MSARRVSNGNGSAQSSRIEDFHDVYKHYKAHGESGKAQPTPEHQKGLFDNCKNGEMPKQKVRIKVIRVWDTVEA